MSATTPGVQYENLFRNSTNPPRKLSGTHLLQPSDPSPILAIARSPAPLHPPSRVTTLAPVFTEHPAPWPTPQTRTPRPPWPRRSTPPRCATCALTSATRSPTSTWRRAKSWRSTSTTWTSSRQPPPSTSTSCRACRRTRPRRRATPRSCSRMGRRYSRSPATPWHRSPSWAATWRPPRSRPTSRSRCERRRARPRRRRTPRSATSVASCWKRPRRTLRRTGRASRKRGTKRRRRKRNRRRRSRLRR